MLEEIKKREETTRVPDIPVGKWVKCEKCKEILYKEILHNNFSVCPNCGHHFRLSARRRLKQIADEGTFKPMEANLQTANPLNLEDYPKKLSNLKEKTGIEEAIITGTCKIEGEKVALGIMDGNFLMGSMGVVVGEKITRLVEKAIKENLPLIIFSVSGGARMQEGMHSLMQMAKTSAAIAKHNEKGLLYISVLTDPTYGGVTASFASLGDIILAEPQAMIGFAGQRVIKQTIGEELPKGFQTSEFLLQHGFIDKIVQRKDMKQVLGLLLKMHKKHDTLKEGKTLKNQKNISRKDAPKTAWEKVQIARSTLRATSLEYIEKLFTDFIELHGDRYYKDDNATVCGIGTLEGKAYTIIAQQKGRNTKENIKRNFGMPNPESYRKALRIMKQAEKFHRPIITFIDTKGAYPGLEAEERGQGEAIAKNLMEMSRIKVPIIAIVIGEGSSGGALALSVADKIIMLENAIYSILSPEGYASILWKDSTRAQEAAEKMKLTAQDLLKEHIIDGIIAEPEEGANHENIMKVIPNMYNYIVENIKELEKQNVNQLLENRYQKYRNMGDYIEIKKEN